MKEKEYVRLPSTWLRTDADNFLFNLNIVQASHSTVEEAKIWWSYLTCQREINCKARIKAYIWKQISKSNIKNQNHYISSKNFKSWFFPKEMHSAIRDYTCIWFHNDSYYSCSQIVQCCIHSDISYLKTVSFIEV